MNIITFIGTLILCIGITSLFFSFINYAVSMIGFILFLLPTVGIVIIGFKSYSKIERRKS